MIVCLDTERMKADLFYDDVTPLHLEMLAELFEKTMRHFVDNHSKELTRKYKNIKEI